MEEVTVNIPQNNKKTETYGAVKIADEVVKIIAGKCARGQLRRKGRKRGSLIFILKF